MKLSQLSDGISVEVRAAGVARFFGASVLALWLGGWVLGEGFALTMLGTGAFALFRKLVYGEADRLLGMTVTAALLAGLFLSLWLALWTLGGVAAMYRFAQLMWGVEKIHVRGEKLSLIRRAWPFGSSREVPLDRVRGVDDQLGALVIETADDTERLFQTGKQSDRAAAREALKPWLSQRREDGAMMPHLPKGWLVREDGASGYLVLGREPRSRRIGGAILGIISALLGTAAAFAVVEIQSRSIGAVLAAFTAVFLWGAMRGLFAEITFRFQGERAERRVTFLGRVRSVVIEPSRLELEQSTDSDGDIWYTLSLKGPGRTIRLERRMNGSGPLEALGEFIQTQARHRFAKWSGTGVS